ncbi:MAG: tetratricopeptide repeat protein [Bacteroidota bacterium]
MNFKEFDHSTALSHLVSQYETTTKNGDPAFFEEDSFHRLVDYYEKEGKSKRALETIDHAIHCHQFSGNLYLRKALLLIQANRGEQALDVLEEAEIITPNELEISILQAKAFLSLGQHIEALSLLELLKEQYDCSEIYLQEALIYEDLEQFDNMFDALAAILYQQPTHAVALEKLWFCTEMSRRYEESTRLYDHLLEKDAYSSKAWHNLGQAYAYLGNYEAAIEAYEYAYLIDEDFEFACRDRAEICYELKYYKEALRSYEEILGLFEPDADLYLKAAQCHYHLKQIRQAKNYLAQAALLESMQEDEVLYYIGLCYAAEKDWNLAIEFYKKAIQVDEYKEEYFLSLAQSYWAKADYKSAGRYFQKAIDTAPETAMYWFHYAQFLIERGEIKLAFELLEEAEFYTVDTEVALCKVACLLLTERRDEAFQLFHDTLEEDTQSYHFLYNLMPSLKEDSIVKAIVSFHNF